MKKFLSYFGAGGIGLLSALFILWTDASDSIKIWITALSTPFIGLGYVYFARLAKIDKETMNNWAAAIVFAVAMIVTLLWV